MDKQWSLACSWPCHRLATLISPKLSYGNREPSENILTVYCACDMWVLCIHSTIHPCLVVSLQSQAHVAFSVTHSITQQLHTFTYIEHSANGVIAGRPRRSRHHSDALWSNSIRSVWYSDSQHGLLSATNACWAL